MVDVLIRGVQGPTTNPRGDYDPTAAYYLADQVVSPEDLCTYQLMVAGPVTGILPGSAADTTGAWQLVVRGATVSVELGEMAETVAEQAEAVAAAREEVAAKTETVVEQSGQVAAAHEEVVTKTSIVVEKASEVDAAHQDVVTKTSIVVEKASEVDAAHQDVVTKTEAVVEKAGQVATNAAAVSANTSNAEAARVAAEAARDIAQSASVGIGFTRNTLAELQLITSAAQWATGQVLTGDDAGLYAWSGSAWEKKSVATVPGLNTALTDEAARAKTAESGGLGFDVLPYIGGRWVLVERSGDVPLALDDEGNLLVSGVRQPTDLPLTWRGGRLVYARDADDVEIAWVDQHSLRGRLVGDADDSGYHLPNTTFGVLAGNAGAVFRISGEGRAYFPAAVSTDDAEAFLAPDRNGVSQILYGGSEGVAQLTCIPVGAYAPAPLSEVRTAIRRGDGKRGFVHQQRSLKTGGSVVAIMASQGQSLALGSTSFAPDTQPWLGTPPSDRVRMFNAGIRPAPLSDPYVEANFASLVPAYESKGGDDGEGGSGDLTDTGMVAMGFGLLRAGYDAVVGSYGHGGASFGAVGPTSQSYANMLYGFERAAALVAAEGRTIGPVVVDWRQGETPGSETPASYITRLDGYLASLVADLATRSITPTQTHVIYQQIMCLTGDELTAPAKAYGIIGLDAAKTQQHVAAPQYICEVGDAYHMYPESYSLMCSHKAKVLRRLLAGESWMPLHVASAVLSGAKIYATFAGGYLGKDPRVTIDTSWVSNPNNYGFGFRDEETTGSVTVTGVKQYSDTVVEISLSGAPSGSTPRLGVAAWRVGSETRQGRQVGVRCCVHDFDPETCPSTGIPLHNYPLGHEVALT